MHAIASLKVLLDATKPQNGRVQTYRSDGTSNGGDGRPDVASQGTEVTHIDSIASSDVASSALHHPNGDLQSESNSLGNNVSYVGTGGRKRENNGLPPSNIPPIPEDEGPESPPTTPIAVRLPEHQDWGATILISFHSKNFHLVSRTSYCLLTII